MNPAAGTIPAYLALWLTGMDFSEVSHTRAKKEIETLCGYFVSVAQDCLPI